MKKSEISERPVQKLAYGPLDTCAMLGIGTTLFWNMVKSGELRTIRIGGRRLVPDSELRDYLARKIAEAQRDAA